MRWLIPMTLLGLTACEMTPTTVEMSDVDDGMARELYKTVCKGLEMKDEDVRTYASENLQDVEDPKAQACYCERVWRNDELDLPIARGLIASARDDMVECTLPALDGANVSPEDKLALVDILIKSNSKVADDKLVELARDSSDIETRVLAISSIGGTDDASEISLLHDLLGNDEPKVRKAAAAALVGQKGDETHELLFKAAADDADGEVRAEALSTLKGVKAEGIDGLLCTAMMEDESPAVRKQAVLSLKGTKKKENLACIKKRAMTEETDPDVRVAILKTLRANDKSWPILCDAIPFYMKTYIDEQGPESVPGADIAKAQNDVDWNNSYACFQKALRNRRGWSCKGHQYVAAWFEAVGGKTHVPACEGDENFGVVSFQ